MSRSLVANARGYVRWRQGQHADAAESLREGVDLHDRAGQSFGRPFALWCLGHLALDNGEWSEAEGLHAAAFSEARRRGDADGIACGLEGLAEVATADGRAALGARLLGAAGARRAAMAASDPILSRDRVAAVDARLRRRLGTQVYDREFAAGTAFDLETPGDPMRSLDPARRSHEVTGGHG